MSIYSRMDKLWNIQAMQYYRQADLRDIVGSVQTTAISKYPNKASQMIFLVSQCIERLCLNHTVVY